MSRWFRYVRSWISRGTIYAGGNSQRWERGDPIAHRRGGGNIRPGQWRASASPWAVPTPSRSASLKALLILARPVCRYTKRIVSRLRSSLGLLRKNRNPASALNSLPRPTCPRSSERILCYVATPPRSVSFHPFLNGSVSERQLNGSDWGVKSWVVPWKQLLARRRRRGEEEVAFPAEGQDEHEVLAGAALGSSFRSCRWVTDFSAQFSHCHRYRSTSTGICSYRILAWRSNMWEFSMRYRLRDVCRRRFLWRESHNPN